MSQAAAATTGGWKGWNGWWVGLAASLVPLLILPVHIAVLAHFYARPVDRRFCSCSCWDTVFKGPYESGIASYKHVYFNATPSSWKIWLLMIGGVLTLYECCKRLLKLFAADSLRTSMLVLFTSSMFAHYYSWWVYFNYYNDDFFDQWNHQMFFTITEILSTVMVLNMADKQNQVTSRKVLTIVGISVLHIIASGVDQFIYNVVLGEGYSHQVFRDLFLMAPDIMHVAIPLAVLERARRDGYVTRHRWYRDAAMRKDLSLMIIAIATGLFVCSML